MRVMDMETAMRGVRCAMDEAEAAFRRIRACKTLSKQKVLDELSEARSCLGGASDDLERVPE